MKNIEQKLEEIIEEARWKWIGRCHTLTTTEHIVQTILTSPDIAVVEKDKLQKMQRVVEAGKRLPGGLQGDIADEIYSALADLEG